MKSNIFKFTIQNVSIKLMYPVARLLREKNLQYKMFLLNDKQGNSSFIVLTIYNTKCFY